MKKETTPKHSPSKSTTPAASEPSTRGRPRLRRPAAAVEASSSKGMKACAKAEAKARQKAPAKRKAEEKKTRTVSKTRGTKGKAEPAENKDEDNSEVEGPKSAKGEDTAETVKPRANAKGKAKAKSKTKGNGKGKRNKDVKNEDGKDDVPTMEESLKKPGKRMKRPSGGETWYQNSISMMRTLVQKH